MLVKTKEFNTAIKNASHALCKEKNRPVLCNYHIFTDYSNLYIESVDGYRFHQSKIEIKEDREEFNLLVKDIKPVKSKATYIDIKLKDNILHVDDSLYFVDLDNAKNFIDYKNVYPNYDNDNYIFVNSKFLYDALKDISNETNDKMTPVKLQFEVRL